MVADLGVRPAGRRVADAVEITAVAAVAPAAHGADPAAVAEAAVAAHSRPTSKNWSVAGNRN